MLDINRLLTALDLSDLVRQAGGKLANGRQSCACPLHGGDNPAAFHLFTSEDGHPMWHCFTKCGSGNALTFLARWKNLEGMALIHEAADRAGLSMSEIGLTEQAAAEYKARELRRDVLDLAARYYRGCFAKNRAARAYARKRAFGWQALSRFGYSDGSHGLRDYLKAQGADLKLAREVGLLRADGTDFTAAANGKKASPCGYLIYLHTASGRTEYLSARAITPAGEMPDPNDKSRNLPTNREHFPQAIEKQVYRAEVKGDRGLVIVEGQADAESLRQLGRSAWALCGTTLTDDDVRAAGARASVHLVLDDDGQRPGTEDEKAERRQRAAERVNKIATRLGPLTLVGVSFADEIKDFNEWLQHGADRPAVLRALKLAKPWIDVQLDAAGRASVAEMDEVAHRLAALVARLPDAARDRYFRKAAKVLELTPREFTQLMTQQRGKGGDYVLSEVRGGRMHFMGMPLCNWSAHISDELTIEDGFSPGHVRYTIEAQLASGEPLDTLEVEASEFEKMEWTTRWGARVVNFVTGGRASQLARAIKEVSAGNGLRRERVYTFTGWTGDNGHRGFLSASGRLHAGGLDPQTRVDLGSNNMRHYHLPEPPTGEAAEAAVRASLAFLDVAPRAVTAVLWAAMYAAPLTSLRPLNAVVWPYGPTQSGKSTITHLALAHFGAGFIGTRDFHAPADWTSTYTALEGLMFMAKDMPFVIDDYAPQMTSEAEARDLRKKAALIIRTVGNRSARGRSQGDLGQRKDRPPRGLVLGTSENPILGQSLVGRMIYVTVNRGDVLKDGGNPALDKAQRQAGAGLPAQAMSLYVQWVATNYERVTKNLAASIDEAAAWARQQFPRDQSRLPDYFAILHAAQDLALTCFTELHWLTIKAAEEYSEANRAAILEVVLGQADKIAAESPAQMFFKALDRLFEGGRIYLVPKSYAEGAARPSERAVQVGWFDPQRADVIWLSLEPCLQEVKRFYELLTQHLDTPLDAMRRHLQQARVLKREDKGHIEVSVWLEGKTRRALEIDIARVEELYQVNLLPVDKTRADPSEPPAPLRPIKLPPEIS